MPAEEAEETRVAEEVMDGKEGNEDMEGCVAMEDNEPAGGRVIVPEEKGVPGIL